MTWPDESLQSMVEFIAGDNWWLEDKTRILGRGRLLWAYAPFFDFHPQVLEVSGRTEATVHHEFHATLKAIETVTGETRPRLPVAALPHNDGEVNLVMRAKWRPVLVLGDAPPSVPREFRPRTSPGWQYGRYCLVAPYFGIDKTGKRGGWHPDFVERIRRCEYPNYLWDMLPEASRSTTESILRLDQLQPLSAVDGVWKPSPYRLSDQALEYLDLWLAWLFSGSAPAGDLGEIRALLLKG